MDDRLKSIAGKAASVISGLPCDYGEVRISSSAGLTIVLSGKDVDSIATGESRGGSVRILKDGAWGFVSFNDINRIEYFAKKCLDIASRINSKEKTGIINSAPVRNDFFIKTGRDFNKVSFDEKFALIKRYNDILNSSKYIQTTNAIYKDLNSEYIYLNSEGAEIFYDKKYCGISLASVAKDGSVIQPFHESVSGYGGYEIVENRAGLAERVVKTAVDLLKAESLPGGTYDVIVDQKLAGVFIHEAFGHLSEGDSIYENEEMKKMMVLGRRFGPDELNIIDDGTMEGLPGFIPVDDEGILPEKTYLVNKGHLSGRLHSRETAYRMNEKPTGNGRAINVMRQPIVRMTNTYIENGPCSFGEIFNSVDKGVYAADVIGGQTNLEMFTFTSGYGYEIKKGRKGKMFRDIVLSGNVFKTLMNIDMIGNDRKMFGGLGGCGKEGQGPLPVSFGGPHMLIKNVLTGGKQ